MADEARYVVVLPSELEPAIRPTVPDIDVAGVAQHMATYMDKQYAFVPVFICCGCAEHEVQVCRKLWQMGYTLKQEMFMDRTITSVAIKTIQCYSDETHTATEPCPVLLFTFKDLRTEILRLIRNDPTTRFIVIGIHASQHFQKKQEVYEFHDFMCTCARLAEQGSMQPEYHNYMERGIMLDTTCGLGTCQPCQPGSGTWVFHKPWWEHACDVITCASAARLLLEAV
jgi:hypothetical protein